MRSFIALSGTEVMILEYVTNAWRPRERLEKGFRSKVSSASLTVVPLYSRIPFQRASVLQKVKGEGNWLR
jgi:hypothetical protein